MPHLLKHRTVLVLLLVSASSFLRLFRIYDLTEFQADQGRTGIEVYNALVEKSLPLVGPPVLTGEHLGPFFYYLIAPVFILTNFNPIAPAVFMAILGILSTYLIFYLGQKLFGFWIALFLGALYAVSPPLIMQTRTLWDPTPIPFFVLLFILCVYKIYSDQNFRFFLLLGVVVGILVQLHYPNLFFIGLALIFFIYLFFTQGKKELKRKIIQGSLLSLAGFSAVLLPFLLYEFQHGFEDLIRVLVSYAKSGSNVGFSKSTFLGNIAYLSSRPFANIFPSSSVADVIQLELIIIPVVLIFRRNFWLLFFIAWFFLGILAMSFYRGLVYNHYLSFLIPVPFFLFGFFIEGIRKFIPKSLFIIPLLVLLVFNATKVDVFSEARNDIERTGRFTNEIISLTKNGSFSFTLISSEKHYSEHFSDLHYRYFFLIKNVHPKKITDPNYDLLFLACEKQPCPTKEELEREEFINALCFDPHCSGEYPTVSLADFELTLAKDVFDGRIFTYKRRE